jgi:hypothetical protein
VSEAHESISWRHSSLRRFPPARDCQAGKPATEECEYRATYDERCRKQEFSERVKFSCASHNILKKIAPKSDPERYLRGRGLREPLRHQTKQTRRQQKRDYASDYHRSTDLVKVIVREMQ